MMIVTFRLLFLSTLAGLSWAQEDNSYYESCEKKFQSANISECCNRPLFLPPLVSKRCSQMSALPVPEGQVATIKKFCQAECAMNMTRVLTNLTFSVDRAKQVLTSRIPPNTKWSQLTEQTVEYCHRVHYIDTYVLTEADSAVCLPMAYLFLECLIRKTYIACPDVSWRGGKGCNKLMRAFVFCHYTFVESIEI